MQKQQKRRKKEKKKERERERRRRNGDASSRSDCISPWLRSFNNGGKYPKSQTRNPLTIIAEKPNHIR